MYALYTAIILPLDRKDRAKTSEPQYTAGCKASFSCSFYGNYLRAQMCWINVAAALLDKCPSQKLMPKSRGKRETKSCSLPLITIGSRYCLLGVCQQVKQLSLHSKSFSVASIGLFTQAKVNVSTTPWPLKLSFWCQKSASQWFTWNLHCRFSATASDT